MALKHEQVDSPVAFVLGVDAFLSSRSCKDRNTGFLDQLLALFFQQTKSAARIVLPPPTAQWTWHPYPFQNLLLNSENSSSGRINRSAKTCPERLEAVLVQREIFLDWCSRFNDQSQLGLRVVLLRNHLHRRRFIP